MPSLAFVCRPDWAGDAELSAALRGAAPSDCPVVAVPADDVAALGGRHDAVLLAPHVDAPALVEQLRAGGHRGPVAAIWPHRWPRELARFHALYAAADAVVINDARCWDRLGRLPRSHPIGDAVDLDAFAGGPPVDRRPRRILLARDPGRRPGGGPDRWLDEEALWQLRDLGLPVVAPDPAVSLRDWLHGGAVVVGWTDDEDSRRVLLAAAAAGCAVACSDEANPDGLVEDGVSGVLTGFAPAELRAAVERALRAPAAMAAALRERVAAWAWTKRAPEYVALVRRLLDGARAEPAGDERRDLRAAVTVFVTTVGAPSYAACRQHLAAQDCAFTLQEIADVAPMSAAFQRMLDTCTTPFYVQVDEDMLLYPHAVRTLYEQATAAPPNVAVVVGHLLDAHVDSVILGVKIFRHAIVARYPFADSQSFEMAQIDRMRSDGFTHLVLPRAATWRASTVAAGILGLHGTHWTPRSIFERYATYERTRHARPTSQRALRGWTSLFLERVMTTGSELDLFALLGVLAGRLDDDGGAGAKDFRRYQHLTGLTAAEAFLDELVRRRR